MTHTYNTVADLLQERWESDLPDKVLEALRPFDGKAVTTRLLDKLPGGKAEWRLRREYGMTHIENKAYFLSSGNSREGVSLLVDWRTDAFPLDIKALEERNGAYFSARKERNHGRMEARNDRKLLEKMAAAMNKAEAARQALTDAKAEFEELAGYGKAFHPDYYELEKACGLREKEKTR